MIIFASTFLVLSSVVAASGGKLVPPPQAAVHLGYATYQGVVDRAANITNFLGIRYAAAPVGPLRFARPHPPPTVPGLTPAITQPNRCFQAGSGKSTSTNPLRDLHEAGDGSAGLVDEPDGDTAVVLGDSEDCLFLNVHVPGDFYKAQSLPVVVWIHGGGYLAGGAAGDNGADLVKVSKHGVVAVVIQYRLGLFGFLPGKEVKAGGVLNAGLLDQEFALRWVQTHIAKFGGDPKKVTIWGESAGAGSVLQQVIARNGQTNPPLFRGAIASSTFLPSQYAFDEPIPQGLYDAVVARTNCPGDSTLSCLRSKDALTLQATNTALNSAGFFGTFVFVPVIDGEFVVRRPSESLKMGRVNGKALLAVTNTNEGLGFVDSASTSALSPADYAFLLFPKFKREVAEKAGQLYRGRPATGADSGAARIQGEAIFICPSYFFAEAFKARTAFVSDYAVPPASHGDDVAYYFISHGPPRFTHPSFTTSFSESFLSFVISQNPNIKISEGNINITPPWSKFSGGERFAGQEMLFNRTVAGEPDIREVSTDEGLAERCRFWESVGAFTGQ